MVHSRQSGLRRPKFCSVSSGFGRGETPGSSASAGNTSATPNANAAPKADAGHRVTWGAVIGMNQLGERSFTRGKWRRGKCESVGKDKGKHKENENARLRC
ncbi:protein of unknown function [Methylocella tundrae]|uniref:Uncharacterized protein n=1 Tax=Methylocella tundrae TaxID=227605 RepID=A0A4V6IML3_METTU|nr:protein of unknown function [Methylocella tundrae]